MNPGIALASAAIALCLGDALAMPRIFEATKRPEHAGEPAAKKWFYAVGGGAYGAENPMGLPKVGAGIRPFAWTDALSDYYLGFSASAWIIIFPTATVSAETGFQFDRFSLDCSLAYSDYGFGIERDSSSYYKDELAEKWTFNPKVGMRIFMVWIRVGPSFELSQKFPDIEGNQEPQGFKGYFLKDGDWDFPNIDILVNIHF